jgi:hypothetical protein
MMGVAEAIAGTAALITCPDLFPKNNSIPAIRRAFLLRGSSRCLPWACPEGFGANEGAGRLCRRAESTEAGNGQAAEPGRTVRGRHFDREVIILCVRWYLRFKLSLRDLVEMMAERGLSLAHTTIMRWVRHDTPEFEKRWRRFALAVGRSWRVEETYIEIRGEWCYLYRAVDRSGRTVDFRRSARRDVAARQGFLPQGDEEPPARHRRSRWMATLRLTVRCAS